MTNALFQFFIARFTPGQRYGLGLTLALLTVSLAFWGFLETIESWTQQEDFYRLDASATHVAQSLATPGLTAFFHVVTYFGSVYVIGPLVAVLAFLFWRRDERPELWAILTAYGAGEALLFGLKAFFHRTRPTLQLATAHGYSFPSGHSFTAFVVYGLLAYLLWKRSIPRAWQVAGSVVLGALILLVGFSRIYLGVHFFTDVVGGFLLGLGWLVASITLIRLLYPVPYAPSGSPIPVR